MRMRIFLVCLVCLLPACAATAPEPPTRRAPFRPSEHGFRFVNSFRGTPLPRALRGAPVQPWLRDVLGGRIPDTFGLCGGMSLTAADHYLAGEPLPSDTRPPAEGTALYEHLLARQNDSLGPGAVMVTAFMRWMMLPDTANAGESTASLTGEHLPGILSRLDRGEIVPLGLVLVRARASRLAHAGPVGDIWANHQVIAYAYERRGGGVIDLRIYDPNFPGDDGVVIRLSPAGPQQTDASPRLGVRLTGDGRRTSVRGVFPMPYTPATPFRSTRNAD
jgi:hypothetical protein